LAARIKGKTSPKVTLGGDETDPTKAKDLPPGTVNAIVVMDIDMLSGPFFRVRAEPDVETGMEYQFQNVPFLLNVVDSLAGDNRFLAVRNRRQRYGTLTRFEERAEIIRRKVEEIIEKAATEYNKTNEDATEAYKTAEKTWQEKMAKIEGSENPNLSEILDARYKRNLEIAKKAVESDLAKRTARVDRTKKLAKAEEDRERDTRRLEANYKLLAVLLPPLPPLCLALVVYGFRRAREREGVAKSRLR
jgi:ABC-2 type transport system permease protein